MRQTLEQERAKFALEKVRNWADRQGADTYARHIRKLPAMVRNHGLGQALAFLLADDAGEEKPSGTLYKDLGEWLINRRIYAGDSDKLMDQLVSCSRDNYTRAQEETLAFLNWMTKFADAFLPKRTE
jgi:CRISPR-associated protein Cmr5